MRGLLEKDMRLTLTRKQTLFIFFILALVMGVSMDGTFIIGYLTMLATIVAVGTVSYDEFDNGLAFLMTLPFERKTYVKEKYLFCLIMAAAAWCIGLVLYGIGNAVRHNGAALLEELPMLVSLIPALFLAAAIMIPLQLKYGSEKSRVVLFLIFGIIAVVILGGRTLFGGDGNPGNPLAGLAKMLDAMSPAVVLLVIVLVCAVISCASYLWSVRIMEEKEF